MRNLLIAFCILLGAATPAAAQLSINFGAPGVSIGINLGAYPTLQRVPGYPVYYAPGVRANYFFYDGLYWVYQGDNWYESTWYNGPWTMVDPYYVPEYVLRVPVRYYRRAPSYFRNWRADDAPRWGEHWGQSWEKRRSGWNDWNRQSAPAPAPLPTYQRQYTGSRYPQASQQAVIQTQNYRYRPADPVAQQHYEHMRTQAQSAPQQQPQQQPARTRQQQPQQQQPQQQQQQAQQPRQQQQRPQQQQQQQQQQTQPQAQPQPSQIARPPSAQRPQQQPPQQAQPQQQKQQQPQQAQPQPKENAGKGKGQDKGQDKGQGGERGKGKEKDNQDQRG